MNEAFDLSKFEAEVALNLILTDQLFAVAQNALEAGFDRPHALRMVILEPLSGSEVNQALPQRPRGLTAGSVGAFESGNYGIESPIS